ncbi:MAG: sodium ion-translocating decarboxylase subunit beta [Firmicutes bacterium]|nr:sodium ion-translocating decarboxylase subunit beta [Bacillota bacterium]
METILENVRAITWQMLLMWCIGGGLIYLAIRKNMEPALLLPMGFGAILVNLPFSGAITQSLEAGPLDVLFQAGIFLTLILASALGFPIREAASIAVIAAADGPTSIFVANYYSSKYLGAIIVAAYSYMALVPILQPPVIRLMTTKKERKIHMKYAPKSVSKTTKILFPILMTVISGILAPKSVALIGFLMFGTLIRECGVLEQLSETAQKVLANLITLILGLTVATKMQADLFLAPDTLLILGLGLAGFVLDTAGGVLVAKLVNLFLPEGKKVNPMIGAAGISAFPMSARIVHKMGQQEDNQNFLLMHAVAVNVSGQIASVLAAGALLTLVP